MDTESKQLLQEIKQAFTTHKDEVGQKVEDTVKVVVNGKIDRLSATVKDWIEGETGKRLAIEKKLDDYMDTTQPMIDFFEDMTSSKRILLWLLGGLASIGGFYLMVREIFK